MKNKRKQIRWGWLAAMVVLLASCTISYKFNGASIDYTKTKTIQITPFPLRSAYVWAPMQSIFNNRLTDVFATQTRLIQVQRNGDLQIAGEITGYEQYNKAISADGAAQDDGQCALCQQQEPYAGL